MINGLDRFKEYFKDYTDAYVVIGGTALQRVTLNAGFATRITPDIDMVLIVEAVTPAFVTKFYQFIEDGEYGDKEEGKKEERCYYRFRKPAATDFPKQIELFSRSTVLDLTEGQRLTPIDLDDDVSHLSALLMDEEYYAFTIVNSIVEDNFHFANLQALVCLKAKAYLDLSERKENGDPNVKDDHIKKHRRDVFLLGATLTPDERFNIPAGILAHLQTFIDTIANDLPSDRIFIDILGVSLQAKKVLEAIKTAFHLK
ncbi:MAG: hypothetical protein ABI581_05125 [Sediminibacterium sp.]